MNALKNRHWIGIRRETGGEHGNKPGKGLTVLEEAGKCGKTWNEVKSLAGNRVRWRCLTNALCS
jgi:hypothetical protein